MVTYSRLLLEPLGDVGVSVVPQPGATLMSVVADVFGGRAQGVHPVWRRMVREAVPGDAPGVLRPLFAPGDSRVPDCLTATVPLRETDPAVQLERLADLPQDVLLAELEADFGRREVPSRWRAVVARPRAFIAAYASVLRAVWRVFAPVWSRARPLLARETQRMGIAAVSEALEPALAGISPRVRFSAGTLHVPDPRPERFELAGRRLVLVPMVSGHGASVFSFDRADAVWLGYPVPDLATLWEGRDRESGPEDGLALVVGDLRARILRELPVARTMGELAGAVGCPPATATYHCGHLEAADLVARERRRQHVWVSRTSRGAALVDLLSRPCP